MKKEKGKCKCKRNGVSGRNNKEQNKIDELTKEIEEMKKTEENTNGFLAHLNGVINQKEKQIEFLKGQIEAHKFILHSVLMHRE